jgi:N-acetylneuraminic acid mutarotase
MGGWDSVGANTTTLYRYDPILDSYQTLAPFTVGTSGQAAAYLDGKIYRIGGCAGNCAPATDSVEVYTIASNSWASAASLPQPSSWLMAVANDGYVYVAGGLSGITSQLKTYRYDPLLNAWDDAIIADLPVVRWGAASDFVGDQWILSGGYVNDVISASAIAWDPATNAWLGLPDMLQARSRTRGAAVGPAFYDVGGRDSGGGFVGTRDNQRYLNVPCQPCASTNWLAAQPYPQTIVRYAFGQVGDDFYIFGGVSNGSVVNTARRYNAVSNTWTDLAPVPNPGEALGAAYWNGKFYVTQGSGGTAFQAYDIATNTWSPLAPYPSANTYGAAIGAYNGIVYAAGGQASPISATYIYNVGSNTWSPGLAAPAPFFMAGYAQVGQYLYVVGGYGTAPLVNSAGLSASSLLAENSTSAVAPEANSTLTMRLDMNTGTWDTGPAWSMARADFALASDGTRLYAIGGDTTGGSYFDSSAEVDEYLLSDWPGGSWVASPPNLPSVRQANQAGFFSSGCAGGEIWSIGGVQPGLIFLPDNLRRAVRNTCDTSICPGTQTITGSLGPGDLVATQRLFRSGIANTCAAPTTCSVFGSGTFYYDQYPFVNNTWVPQCVTITANSNCSGTDMVFVASYNGNFDPSNICTNWDADSGSSPTTGSPKTYSYIVHPGQKIVFVVEGVSGTTTCSGYDLTMSADNCAGVPVLRPFYIPLVQKH